MGCRTAFFLITIAYFFSYSNIYAQEVQLSGEESIENNKGISQRIPADTTEVSDSIAIDTGKSDVETTILYDARDSIIMSMDQNIVDLYGQAHIEYGVIVLDAAHITINYTDQTLTAVGVEDSLGRLIDKPIFKNGQEVYETKRIVYNFKTGKAQITEVVTTQGEGFLQGKAVFKNARNELFSIDNTYTTCNLPHPHYRIRARRTKAIPDDKIVSGLFNLEINDVPTPLGFPFGMFPDQKEGASGIIVPSYGEEQRRGFFLRGGGYFFDISDYVKVRLTGDLYSKGGHGLHLSTEYNKRYSYRGSFNFSYTQLRNADRIENVSAVNDYSLNWSHSPQSRGNSRFSAQVNAATSSFTQNNFIGVPTTENINNLGNLHRKLTSSLTYSKKFGNSPFTLGLSGRHSQDVISKQVDVSLPELSFTMNNLYPFQNVSDKSIIEKLNVRWTMNGTNQIDNLIPRVEQPDSVAPFNFDNLPIFIRNGRNGIRHNIPLNTSFNILKFFSVNPSISYQERWYFQKLQYTIDPETQRPVASDTIRGFNRVYDYSFSAGLNTRIYGTYFFNKGKIKAIRHVANPVIGFSYRPDFSKDRYGFYQTLVNERGQIFTESRHQGFVYGGAPRGESGSVSLGINNTLEMKVQNSTDSTDNIQKVSILNNFGINTSYNFLADSFQLSNINIRANTALFNDKLNLSVSGTIDPYLYRIDDIREGRDGALIYDQTRVNQLSFRSGRGLGTLSNINIAMSTNLNPKANKREQEIRETINDANLPEAERLFALQNAEDYVDFTIPWSLRLSYTLSFNKTGLAPREVTGHAITANGDFSLSDKWKVTFNTGFNFKQKVLSLTTFGVVRDLHCWTMEFNWTPIGRLTNYNLTVRVKSSLLQDLKIDRRRSFFDNLN